MRITNNKLAIIFGFTTFHFLVGLAAFIATFSMGMARFDRGETAGLLEYVIGFIGKAFIFPCLEVTDLLYSSGFALNPALEPFLRGVLLGPGWWALKFLHSFLFTVCGCYLLTYIQRKARSA